MKNNRLKRLCFYFDVPEHVSSTPRKSRKYGQRLYCGWVSLERRHKVTRNAVSNTYFYGNICLAATQVELQSQNSAARVKLRAQRD